jgi:hypothetical protein
VQLGRGAPQQRGVGRGGGVPRGPGVEPPVGGEQLVGAQPRIEPLRQGLLPDRVGVGLGGEEGVSLSRILCKSEVTYLRIVV